MLTACLQSQEDPIKNDPGVVPSQHDPALFYEMSHGDQTSNIDNTDVFHPNGTGDLLPCVPSAGNEIDFSDFFGYYIFPSGTFIPSNGSPKIKTYDIKLDNNNNGIGLPFTMREIYSPQTGDLMSVSLEHGDNPCIHHFAQPNNTILNAEFDIAANLLQEHYGSHPDNPDADVWLHYGFRVDGNENPYIINDALLVKVPIGRDFSLTKARKSLEESLLETQRSHHRLYGRDQETSLDGEPLTVQRSQIPNDFISYDIGLKEGEKLRTEIADQKYEQGYGLGYGRGNADGQTTGTLWSGGVLLSCVTLALLVKALWGKNSVWKADRF